MAYIPAGYVQKKIIGQILLCSVYAVPHFHVSVKLRLQGNDVLNAHEIRSGRVTYLYF